MKSTKSNENLARSCQSRASNTFAQGSWKEGQHCPFLYAHIGMVKSPRPNQQSCPCLLCAELPSAILHVLSRNIDTIQHHGRYDYIHSTLLTLLRTLFFSVFHNLNHSIFVFLSRFISIKDWINRQLFICSIIHIFISTLLVGHDFCTFQ